MSTPQDFMNRLFAQAAAPQVAPEVAQASQDAGLSAATGYGTDSMVPGMEADIRTLSPQELVQKYGYETAMQMLGGQAEAANRYNTLRNENSRTRLGALDDTGSDIASGFINSVLGIAGLGAGLIDDDAGAAVAKAAGAFNESTAMARTQQTQSRRAAQALRDQMRFRDNEAASAADTSTGLMKDLKKIGREAISGGSAMFDDASLLASDVSSGIGSMATGGPIGKGITLGAKGLATAGRMAMGRGAAASQAARAETVFQRALQSMKENGGTMAAITAMEAGGTYNSTVQEIMEMPFEALAQNSPIYSELLNQGMDPETARTELANAAALQAAGKTALIAAPLAALVARFEGNFLTRNPVGRPTYNTLSEAVEEGGVGLGGGIAQNQAVQQYADQTRDWTENVGEQLGQGAVLGAATAGVVQSPRIAAGAASSAANRVLGAAERAKQGEQTKAETAQNQTVQAAVATAAPVVASMAPEVQERWNKIQETYSLAPDDINEEVFGPTLTKALSGVENTPQMVSRLLNVMGSSKLTDEEKVHAAAIATDLANQFEAILEKETAAGATGTEEVDSAIQAMAQSLEQVRNHKVLGDARRQTSEAATKTLNENAETKPEVAARAAETLVTVDPLAVEPEAGRLVLQHAENGTAQMSEASKAALEVSLEVIEADRQARQQLEAEGYQLTNNDKVSQQIRTSEEWGDGTAQSLSGHIGRIFNFVTQGVPEAASEQADHLSNFAVNMLNKVQALNEYYAAGDFKAPNKGYEQYLKDGRWRQIEDGSKSGLFVRPNNERSLTNARAIEADAQMAVNAVNAMADAFPQLGLAKLPFPQLDQGLQGPIQEVLARHARQAAPKQGPAPIRRGQAEEAPVVQPVATPAPVQEAEPEVSASEPEKAPERPRATPEQVEAKKQRFQQMKEEAKAEKPKPNTENPAAAIDTTPLTGMQEDQEADTPELTAARKKLRDLQKEIEDAEDSADFTRVERLLERRAKLAETIDKIEDQVWEAGLAELAQTNAALEETQEVEETIEEEAPEIASKGDLKADKRLASRFPNLFEKSWFRHIFRGRGESNLLEGRTPEQLADLLGEGNSELSEKLGDIPSDTLSEYQNLLRNVAPAIMEHLNESLQKFLEAPYSKNGPTNLEKMLADDVLFHTPTGRLLNLIEQSGDRYVFNQELIFAGALAGLHWYLNAGGNTAVQSADEWTEALGVAVNANQAAALNQGTGYEDAISNMASRIQDYWNVTPEHAAPSGMVQGVLNAMAQQVLETLTDPEIDLAKIENVKLKGFDPNTNTEFNLVHKEVRRVFINKEDMPQALVKDTGVIDRMLAKEPGERRFYIGEDRPVVQKARHNQPRVLNTPEQVEVLRDAVSTPYYFNPVAGDLLGSLEKDAALTLFAEGPLEKLKLNKYDRESREGRNQGVIQALDVFNDLKTALDSRTEEGKDISDVPVFYGWNFTSVNRLMMLGDANPQANKVIRALMLPTWSTMDLTSEQGTRAWALAVGQGLGIKIHTQDLEKTRRDVETLLTGKLADAMSFLRDWEKDRKSLSVEQAKQLRQWLTDAGVSDPAWGMFVLLEQARLENTPQAQRKSFKTPLYLEADGVTNGPLMGMMMLMTTHKSLDPQKLTAFQKGGVALGRQGMTLADMRAEDKVDLYGSSGQLIPELIAENIAQQSDPALFQKATMDLLRLMENFLGAKQISVKRDDQGREVIQIERGLTKNPLTITLYGSGAKGIAGNFVDEMLEEFHARTSRVMQTLPKNATEAQVREAYDKEFGESYDLIGYFLDNYVSLDRETDTLVITENQKGTALPGQRGAPVPDSMLDDGKTMEDSTFSQVQYANLQSFIQHLFVGPLQNSIANAVGDDTMQGMTVIRQVTSAQSELAVEYFRAKLYDKLEEKKAADPAFRTADFLTGAELDELFADMAEKFPPVEVGGFTFDLMGKVKGYLKDVNVSDILTGNRKMAAKMYGPDSLGVGGIPSMIIGSGDASMILSAYLTKKLERTLPVYDGVHLPLDQIDAQSELLNDHAFQAMMNNPVKAVVESLKATLKRVEIEPLLQALDEQAKEAMQGKKGKVKMTNSLLRSTGLGRLLRTLEIPLDKYVAAYNRTGSVVDLLEEDIFQQLDLIVAGAEYQAEMIDLNHKVVGAIGGSVDQMASAAASHQIPVSQGNGLAEDLTYEQISNEAKGRLKTLMLNSKNAVVKMHGEMLTLEPKAMKDLPPLAPVAQGEKLPSGVTKLSMEHLLERSRGKDLTDVQRQTMREVLRTGALSGWTIVTGTPEQLSAYSASAGEALSSKSDSVVHGATDLNTKTIYLPASGSETLIHEMVHAATLQLVLDTLTNKKVPNHVKQAVRNLESLFNDFMAIRIEQMPAGAMISYRNARSAAEQHMRQGTPEGKAAAINEMMAWVLGNPSLSEALKAKSVSRKVVEFTQRLFNAVRRMFWGSANVPRPVDNFVSSLLFNTTVLINTTPTRMSEGTDTVLQHSTPGSARLQQLKERLAKRLDAFMSMDVDPSLLEMTPLTQSIKAAQAATDKLNQLAVAGFDMNAEQRETSKLLMTVMGTTMEIDSNVMNTAQKIYNHAVQNLTPDSFSDVGVDPSLAAEMYDAITGKQQQGRDPLGRSLLLPSFLAMALTNETMQAVLEKIPAPKNVEVKADTLDQTLENFGNRAMEVLDQKLTGQTGKESSVMDVISKLSSHVQASTMSKDNWFEKSSTKTQSLIDKGNDVLVSLMKETDKRAAKSVAGLRADPDSWIKQRAADALTLLRVGLSDEGADRAAMTAATLMNQKGVSQWVRDLVTDITGRTSGNAALYDMIKLIRTKVQQMRQHYRDEVPTIFHKRFKNAPTDAQYASMYRVLGKTGLAALSVDMALDVLRDESRLDAELAKAKTAAESVARKGYKRELMYKADQLANYLVTGLPGVGLLRNSYAIAAKTATVKDEEVIDTYVTLKALKDSSKEDKEAIRSLLPEDTDAIRFMLSYNQQQLAEDRARIGDNKTALMNHFKGYLPASQKQGQKLMVRPISEHADLVERGYTQVGMYAGSSAERIKEPRAYYFSPVDGQAVFNQGLIQNTQHTVGGIQMRTGHSLNHNVAGRITNEKTVRRIEAEIARTGDKGVENLMPVFNDAGQVVAYERAIRQDMQARVVAEYHYGKSLGMWRGRQVEEQAGEAFNVQLAKELKKVYDSASAVAKKTDFIDLRSAEAQKDPVLRDALLLMPKEVVEMLEEQFGEDEPIWVERSMLKDVVGYRAATVGDMWTGNTRLSPAATAVVKDVLVTFLGKDAYTKAVQGERFLQGVVTDARVLIAVKSVVVPAVNMLSNLLHLISRGVPLHEIAKMPAKLNELHQYVQSESDRIRAETELTAAKPGSIEHRRLTNRLQAIQDGQRRLSIWPLIEAGEFSTVAEVGMTHEDLLLSRGRLSDYIERQADKLPTGASTVAHNLMLSKHTAIFRGLQKSVQYGDFLGKAVLYDHLVKTKGMPSKMALGQITEEFVNYDRLPGRTRGYLESIGMLWFYNFKLRSVKVAMSTIRNNPLNTFLAVNMPVPDFFGSAGLPVEDNALSKLLGGSLGYSIGPGQGMGAIGLNPWYNLVN